MTEPAIRGPETLASVAMPFGRFRTFFLSAVTLALLTAFYTSSIQSPDLLSPQGCRMSWMSPSYILQPAFNATWTRLARRYSLWLYREVGWESHEKLTGVPVLFIPGNAGSSRQVRSIASSATRQYYIDPYQPRPEFISRGLKQLDFFAVEFNEDFSALHGPTLLSERSYTSSAIKYILSLYPPRTRIILMGHSMGGIVALSLLPSPDISAIITMSTPHSLPPARLDKRIEDIYSDSWDALRNESTPVLSVCGGATDLMIPSETCSMQQSGPTVGWRKTVFTTSMEGTWTGVGHREMVWCHQVRWRVARAALELGIASSDSDRGVILDHWFRDSVDRTAVDASVLTVLDESSVTRIPPDHRLIIRNPPHQPHIYLIPLPSVTQNTRFTLYVSRGSVSSLSPYVNSNLSVSIHRCRSSHRNCQPVEAQTLKLIPNPTWEGPFPASGEGVDESDGVVIFEASVKGKDISDTADEWIGVTVNGGGIHGSWVTGGFDPMQVSQSDVSRLVPLWKAVTIPVDPTALVTKLYLPKVLSNALLVYRIEPPTIVGSCLDSLLPPLLLHSSSATESHFHPTSGKRPLLIHSHSFGPFIPLNSRDTHGLNLTIYSSGECGVSHLQLTLDWWSSSGRWALRYWSTVCAWAVGIVGIMILHAWDAWEKGAAFRTVPESLAQYIPQTLPLLSGVLLLASLLPLDSSFLLGNSGEPILALLAPLVLLTASGCVAISWYILQSTMWVLIKVASAFGRVKNETRVWRRNIWSLGVVLALVATIIPSQVAFLVCFLIHLLTCAMQTPTPATNPTQVEAYAQKTHALLLLFWLLPLVAPVLAVWVRTLSTAGLTTPFDGDHDVFAVASFLLFVDFASSFSVPVLDKASSWLHRCVTLVGFYALAVGPFAFGGRYTYRVYVMSNLTVGYLVVGCIITRLWTSGARGR